MPLSPLDIHNKEFTKSFRGYDVDEVNDFLDEIIKDFEFLTREKKQLEQQVEELQQELEQAMDQQMAPMQETRPQPPAPPQQQPQQPQPRYQAPEPAYPAAPSPASLSSMEQSIHKSIRVAQEVAEEVRLNAKKEAELIVQEAEKNADRIINEALQKARAVHSELLDLKQKATIYRARFRTLVQSHMDILENSDWESLEELEDGLEEAGQQLDQYAQPGPEPMSLDSGDQFNTQEYSAQDFNSQEFNPTMGSEDNGYSESSYMDEEDEPRRDLRRTSRKMKRKAMF
ncbi:DivIVA domain-containing protein [Marininema halotolerans]|uniref:Cell division initiation protein n=1 Tax=Marininema halotolerans TaxID=1155944 RepID=A0A1I6QCS3_9BACL|nr:DivIVA domain-containing protein [Marininema halotolerans]SFS50266.1 cell division initiation protein [Marininema halotolerans]